MSHRSTGPTSSTPSAIPLEEFDRLGHLFFSARTLVEGLYQGRHATPDRGGSTEFYDYRMYVPGDTTAHVDWKLFGRTDRLYVRRFTHFSDLTLQIVLDASASMDFTGFNPPAERKSKWQYATHLAAAMAFLVTRQGDRAGLSILGERVTILPPSGTMNHLKRLIASIEMAEPVGTGDFPRDLAEAYTHSPTRRVVLILSDFLSEPAAIMRAVHRYRHHRCDVIALQILAPEELELGGLESTQFIDAETGAHLNTHVPSIAEDYTHLMNEHLARLRAGFAAHGAMYRLIPTSTPPLEALSDFLHRRSALRSE